MRGSPDSYGAGTGSVCFRPSLLLSLSLATSSASWLLPMPATMPPAMAPATASAPAIRVILPAKPVFIVCLLSLASCTCVIRYLLADACGFAAEASVLLAGRLGPVVERGQAIEVAARGRALGQLSVGHIGEHRLGVAGRRGEVRQTRGVTGFVHHHVGDIELAGRAAAIADSERVGGP